MDRYWVGNSGNWSDNTNHWSASSGGSPGASKPTINDNVIFDAASFSTGSTVTVDEEAFCNNMSWSLDQTVSFEGSQDLNVGGNLAVHPSTVVNLSGGVIFKATDTGHTIDFAGKILGCWLQFDGIGGGWSLTANLFVTNDAGIGMLAGYLNLNSKTVQTRRIGSDSTNPTGIIAGSVNITLTGTNINVLDIAGATNFSFTGSGYVLTATNTGVEVQTGLNEIRSFVFQNNGLITDNSKFEYLTLATNKTYTVTNGKRVTVKNLIAPGTAGNLVTMLSDSAGNPFELYKLGGLASYDYLSLKDSHAIGGARWYAGTHSTNVSGNEGWIFRAAPTSGPFPVHM